MNQGQKGAPWGTDRWKPKLPDSLLDTYFHFHITSYLYDRRKWGKIINWLLILFLPWPILSKDSNPIAGIRSIGGAEPVSGGSYCSLMSVLICYLREQRGVVPEAEGMQVKNQINSSGQQ